MRKQTRLIIWCVVLSFAVWGGSTFVISSQVLSPYAGSCFGKKIKLREFEQKKKLLKLFLPPEFSALPDPVLNAETFKQIALARAAKREGLRTTDDEVRLTVERIVGQGVWYNPASYAQWARSTLGENPRDFEESLRDMILGQKMMNLIFQRANIRELPAEPPPSEEQKKKIAEEREKALAGFYRQAGITVYSKNIGQV